MASIHNFALPTDTYTALERPSALVWRQRYCGESRIHHVASRHQVLHLAVCIKHKGEKHKGDRFIFTTLIPATAPTLNYSKQITR